MEKTVLVVVGNSFSCLPCGQAITLEIPPGGKGNKTPTLKKSIAKTVWTCCVEAVSEYCRIVMDLFPDQHQVCVAAVDEAKCQPVNSWRDEDQDINKVQAGFQTFGYPVFQATQGAGGGRGSTHLNPCMQGLQYAVRCLAQLTATQYATTTCPHVKKPLNQGRIIFVCCLKNDGDVKELEKAIVNLVKSENADIKQKQDMARLHIHLCQLVLVNTYPHGNQISSVKDSPLTQLSSGVSSVAYSFPATLLLEKSIHLAKMHFDLKSTMIAGIPMKEEQAGGSSANYDVELIHLSEAHRDILRAGYVLGPSGSGKKDSHHKDVITLRWSTPKSTPMELQFCTSAYRVTPSNVTSRPTVCLINFVLSGKSVLLEQSRKGPSKVVSHILSNHGGSIFLHSIPTCRPYLDDPPSISEGWGGRITDYRISDLSELVLENLLYPSPVDRTKIPTIFPIQKAIAKLEHDTRYWPLVYNDTILYTLKQELTPLPDLVKRPVLSDVELEECRRVILDLQGKEMANESLAIPSTGGRNKGVRRDEQYRTLWGEIEMLTQAYSNNSERHRILQEFVHKVVSSAPSCQQLRKTPAVKSETDHTVSTTSDYNAERVWQDLDKYQQMTEREKRDFESGDINNSHGNWKQLTGPAGPPGLGGQSTNHTSLMSMNGGALPTLPVPMKPSGSLLTLWTTRQKNKANSSHVEFAGRSYGEVKTELYSQMRTGTNMMAPPLTQE